MSDKYNILDIKIEEEGIIRKKEDINLHKLISNALNYENIGIKKSMQRKL